MMDIDSAHELEGKIIELPRQPENQRHVVVNDGNTLLTILTAAREQNCFLRAMTVTDERLRESRSFKLYYLISDNREDQLIILETDVTKSDDLVYPSVRSIFPAVISTEEQIYDLFGLKADVGMEEAADGFLLHNPAYLFDEPLQPLRRTRTKRGLDQILQSEQKNHLPTAPGWVKSLKQEGVSILSVGPVHGEIIESGQFLFYVAGEVIESLSLRLGYKHRGIEKLFETHYTLETGWKLAEKISGDSSFAHSLAYCQAVENIVNVTPPKTALYWRALLLELERIYNHIADVGALAHEVAYDRAAAQISSLRETVVQLNQRLSGNRFLRGINVPGGANLPASGVDVQAIRQIVEAVAEEFLELAKDVLENPKCRERMLGTGRLTREDAVNATGFAARASGWFERDWRLQHPQGAYDDPEAQNILRSTIVSDGEEDPNRKIPIYPRDLNGDVFARLAMRVAEVETSAKLILHFANHLQDVDLTRPARVSISEKLSRLPGLNFGVGIVEGWRGDVVYMVFKGQEDTIFRCSPRDPSAINWRIFSKAVQGNRLSDFPLINKSFNLSYAGFDL
jgi:Ni,Fe-hydrogenase III large subunit/Ni,Fe-hydrogenase III component G